MKRKARTIKLKMKSNLRQNSAGGWVLRKKIKGKEIYRVLDSAIKTMAEAYDAAEEILAAELAGLAEVVSQTKRRKARVATIGDIVGRYRDSAAAKRLKGDSVNRNVNALMRVIGSVRGEPLLPGGPAGTADRLSRREARLGKLSSNILNRELVDQYVNYMMERGVKYKAYEKVPEHIKADKKEMNGVERQRIAFTIASVMRKARSLFAQKGSQVDDLLDEEEGIYGDIKLPDTLQGFLKRKTPKPGKKQYMVPVQREILKVINALPKLYKTHPEAYKAFKLGYGTGMRIGEIQYLMWDQIREEEDGVFIYIKCNESFDGPKSGNERKVELKPKLYEELLEMESDDEYVIGGGHSYRKNSVGRDVAQFMRAAGWKRHQCAHELRKYFGAQLHKATGSLADVMHVLGHSSWVTTKESYQNQMGKIDYPDFTESLPAPGMKQVA